MTDTNKRMARRCRTDLQVKAELSIAKAIEDVEAMGADVLLTDAVIHLADAKAKIADYVDLHITVIE